MAKNYDTSKETYMITSDARLTEEQYEELRTLYVFSKTGVPPSPTVESLAQLGLASKMEHKGGVWYTRTEVGVGYLKSIGWTWGFWENPHLPSPPPVAAG